MIREVDLVSYLPQFLEKYKETNLTLTAENPEFVLVWKAADRALKNEFIATADEYGISRFEKMLGIYPMYTDDLETRRMRVKNRWFNATPYTIRTLRMKICELLGGEHHFIISSDFVDKYELFLYVFSLDDSQTEELEYLLSTMVPANIVKNIVYESVHRGAVYFGGAVCETDIIEIHQRQ